MGVMLFMWPNIIHAVLPGWLLWIANSFVLLMIGLIFQWVLQIFGRYLMRHRSYARIRAVLHRLSITDAEYKVLHMLAGSGKYALYRMLERAVIFENRVHRAHNQGMHGLHFITRLRSILGYTTANPQTVVVSTRQLSEGDLCQILLQDHGMVHEFYGVVHAVADDDFSLRLNQESLRAIIQAKNQDIQFGVLLGRGRAIHHFPFHPVGQDVSSHGLRIAHSLLDTKRGSRNVRIPILLNVNCRLRQPGGDDETAEAMLIEVSEGGCSMMFSQRLPSQTMVSFWLPLQWLTPISLVGLVLESHEQSKGWWVARVSVSRMSKPQREAMRNALKREFHRRLGRLEKDLTQG